MRFAGRIAPSGGGGVRTGHPRVVSPVRIVLTRASESAADLSDGTVTWIGPGGGGLVVSGTASVSTAITESLNTVTESPATAVSLAADESRVAPESRLAEESRDARAESARATLSRNARAESRAMESGRGRNTRVVSRRVVSD